jgi:SAM-dependent methyltransferase
VTTRDWNEDYAAGATPWDSGDADPHLVELVTQGTLARGRALEVGCGTGTNAIWLARSGFDVTAIDVAPLAIEAAEAKRAASDARARFAVRDFLQDGAPPGRFDLVFDRGVLHVFDEAQDRARFAQLVAAALAPGGHWLSLAGSTEGPARDHGPPRRTARDLAEAVEPHLELTLLRSITFTADLPEPPRAWLMLARRRAEPAQPSTRQLDEAYVDEEADDGPVGGA